VIKSLITKLKDRFSNNEGLGYLQIYNLQKTAVIVVISIIYAKFIKDPFLINTWETLMLLGTGYTFFYVSGLGYTLVSFIKSYHKNVWPIVFRNTFILLFLFSCVSCLGIIITGLLYQTLAFPFQTVLLFCIYIIGTVCSTVVEYIYFLNRAFKKLMLWGVLNFVLLIITPTLPLLMGYSFIYALYAMAAFGIIRLLFALGAINEPFNLKELQYIQPLLKFNWPIIISLLLGTGYVYIANFIVKSQVNVVDFNLFRYGIREFPVFLVLANSYSIVLSGITLEQHGTQNFWTDTRKSHLRLMHQIFPLACFFMVSSRFIYHYVFSVDFILSHYIFNILLFILVARVMFPQSLLMGKGKTRYSFYSSLIEFVAGIGLVIVLTHYYGIIGTAWAIALAYIIEKIVLIGFCYREKIEFHKSIDWKWYIGYIMILISSFILSSYY